MPPPLWSGTSTPGAAAAFSQANKLCVRATPAQSSWLAQHMATTGRSISEVLREALELYVAAHTDPDHRPAVDR